MTSDGRSQKYQEIIANYETNALKNEWDFVHLSVFWASPSSVFGNNTNLCENILFTLSNVFVQYKTRTHQSSPMLEENSEKNETIVKQWDDRHVKFLVIAAEWGQEQSNPINKKTLPISLLWNLRSQRLWLVSLYFTFVIFVLRG